MEKTRQRFLGKKNIEVGMQHDPAITLLDMNMLHQGYLLTTDQIWNPTPCSAAGERSRFNKECDPSIGSSVHTTLGQHTECAKPDLREKHQTSLLTPGTSKIRTEIKNTHLYLGQAHG